MKDPFRHIVHFLGKYDKFGCPPEPQSAYLVWIKRFLSILWKTSGAWEIDVLAKFINFSDINRS